MPIERANRIPEARSEVQNPEATKLGRPSSLKLRNKLRMNGKRSPLTVLLLQELSSSVRDLVERPGRGAVALSEAPPPGGGDPRVIARRQVCNTSEPATRRIFRRSTAGLGDV